MWDEITAAYRAAGGKQPSDDELRVRLGCTGGLPMAQGWGRWFAILPIPVG